MTKNRGYEKRKMTIQLWKLYKKTHNTIPTCPRCRKPVLVREEFLSLLGKKVKYLCEECIKDWDNNKDGILVYQYPKSSSANKVGKNDNYFK